MRAPLASAARAALAALPIAYTLAAFLAAIPANPISLALRPLLSTTIDTYAHQVWYLFAPEPTSYNTIVAIQPLRIVPDPRRRGASMLVSASPWLDLTSGLWDASERSPFGMDQSIARLEWAAAIAVERASRGDTPSYACLHIDPSACRREPRPSEVMARHLVELARLGSAVCARLFPGDTSIAFLRIAILDQDKPELVTDRSPRPYHATISLVRPVTPGVEAPPTLLRAVRALRLP